MCLYEKSLFATLNVNLKKKTTSAKWTLTDLAPLGRAVFSHYAMSFLGDVVTLGDNLDQVPLQEVLLTSCFLL